MIKMVKKILIESNNTIIFKGSILNIPIKKEAIIKGSVELFDDDDPCIIHTSYVVKQLAEKLSQLLEQSDHQEIVLNDHLDTLDFIDIQNANVRIKKLK